MLARWGILSSRVLLFERDRRGEFRPPARYPRRALVTANTHDLPPLRSFWEGHDLRLRRAVGAIGSDAELAREGEARERERAALRRLLARERALPRDHRGGGRLRGAVHGVLGRTPAALVGIALDDLSGEREPVNLPGISADRFPSWTRRMSMSLERIASDPEAKRALAPIRRRRAPRGTRR
jgi:4-alpha-glucanotransferase